MHNSADATTRVMTIAPVAQPHAMELLEQRRIISGHDADVSALRDHQIAQSRVRRGLEPAGYDYESLLRNLENPASATARIAKHIEVAKSPDPTARMTGYADLKQNAFERVRKMADPTTSMLVANNETKAMRTAAERAVANGTTDELIRDVHDVEMRKAHAMVAGLQPDRATVIMSAMPGQTLNQAMNQDRLHRTI